MNERQKQHEEFDKYLKSKGMSWFSMSTASYKAEYERWLIDRIHQNFISILSYS